MPFLLSCLLSFGAAFVYAVILYWLDRYEKEPKRMLVGVFLWGAIIAIVGAVIAELALSGGVMLLTQSRTLAKMLESTAFAPLVEESLKGFAVLMVFLIFRSEFDSVLDGIVYAGITALGFAAMENTFYVFGAYEEQGMAGLFTLYFVRAILMGWDHPMFTAFTGIGLAVARFSTGWILKLFAPILGWCVAVAAHAFHNGLVTIGSNAACLLFISDWFGWILIFGIMLWAIRREKKWLVENLREEVERGTLSAEQYRVACSSAAQTGLSMSALFSQKAREQRRLYRACAELAFKKKQGKAGDEEALARVGDLRAKVASLALSAT